MWLIFNSNDQMTGFATVPLTTEAEGSTVIKMDVSKLKAKLPEEYDSWKDNRRGFLLSDETIPEVKFDSDYVRETPDETQA